ncbi:putative NRPS-like protein biosynthetic cluster [Clathrus columnatus]|uniref:NRPS-like protein biosynthetic cluster n=1 Tax=Clathrus columnatus TaxID=1419009 RepID=A0AAV5AJ65_9AGAM|nr:putative NRPS-like protein biosynthetic cluster [Clathrus columnatus]
MLPSFERFTFLPQENNLTIDQAHEWHKLHSPNFPAFVYPDDDGQQHYITWKELRNAINTGVQYIKAQIPEITQESRTIREPLIVGILSSAGCFPIHLPFYHADYLSNVADHLVSSTFLLSNIQLTHLSSSRPILPYPISPRNSAAGVAHLLKIKQVKHVWVSEGPMQLLFDGALKHLEPEEIPARFVYPTYEQLFLQSHATTSEENQDNILSPVPLDLPAIILHSSGSTAFPKPITISHQMLMEWGIPANGSNRSSIQYSGYIRSIPNPLSRKAPTVPERFLQEMIKTKTTICFTLPSFIEVMAWATDPQSVEVMRTMKTVYWAGGPLSEHAGQHLSSQGVSLSMMYGATEIGGVFHFTGKTYAEGCEWFRLSASTDPVFLPDSVESNVFEIVFKVAEGHHLAVINTEIDGVPAYATSDLVERHPNNPNLFKIIGRADDQIMLKQSISKNPHVKSAVVFGRGRTSNGVVIEPVSHDEAEQLGLEGFRNLIWPNVEDANYYAPAHSRIFKEMIILASRSKPFIYTAKNTARRGALIKEYDEEIENLYKTVENSAQTDIPLPSEFDGEYGGWSIDATRNFVREVVHSIMKDGSKNMSDEDDFFAYGCDSLQATYIRNTILYALRQVSSSSNIQNLPTNLVYKHPTVNALTEVVSRGSKRKTDITDDTARQRRLQDFIEKYTQNWPKHQPGSVRGLYPEVVLLTGSTGGLGSQILAELITTPSVTLIYAFNRPSKISSRQRHIKAFTDRGNDLSLLDSKKIIYVEGDTSVQGFGINFELFKQLRDSVTTVIHNGKSSYVKILVFFLAHAHDLAWRVDFNISLISFEPAIRGVRHLIDLALASPHTTPPRLVFTSSIGIVKLWANIPVIPEAPINDIDIINSTGYSESKWICEQILETASKETSLEPVIVRVGQICGGINGNWNAREWFPALVKVSLVLKALPEREGLVSFIPLQTTAKALVELRHSFSTFANLVHSTPITWNDMMKWVSEELELPTISYSEWLRRLEDVPRTLELLVDNPALHLLEFYRTAITPAGEKEKETDLQRHEAMGIVSCETTNTIVNAPSLHLDQLSRLSRDDIRRWIKYWNLSKWNFRGANKEL